MIQLRLRSYRHGNLGTLGFLNDPENLATLQSWEPAGLKRCDSVPRYPGVLGTWGLREEKVPECLGIWCSGCLLLGRRQRFGDILVILEGEGVEDLNTWEPGEGPISNMWPGNSRQSQFTNPRLIRSIRLVLVKGRMLGSRLCIPGASSLPPPPPG